MIYTLAHLKRHKILVLFSNFIMKHKGIDYKTSADHLIILDNAKSHNNQMVKDAIIKSGNKYLFSIPYTPMTNSPIENYFNQIKTYIKKKRDVYSFEELAKNVDTSIERVKPENYKNYFEYAYGTTKKTEYTRKSSTRKHKLKLYKDV